MSIFNHIGRSKATKEQLEHLGTLLQRKAALEEKLFAHTVALEKAYIDASQELGVTMKGRIHDMATLGDRKLVFECRCKSTINMISSSPKLSVL